MHGELTESKVEGVHNMSTAGIGRAPVGERAEREQHGQVNGVQREDHRQLRNAVIHENSHARHGEPLAEVCRHTRVYHRKRSGSKVRSVWGASASARTSSRYQLLVLVASLSHLAVVDTHWRVGIFKGDNY